MTTAATLLNTPQVDTDWDRYSFDLAQNLYDIRLAIQFKKHINLPQYQIYPIPRNDVTEWLQRVSQSFNDFTSVLGIQSADIENVNLADQRARIGWAYQIYSEVNAARQALGI